MFRRLIHFSLWLSALAIGCLAYGFLIEPGRLVVRQVSVTSPHWTGEPLRIGIISDIHVGGRHVHAPRVNKVTERLNSLSPDIILLGGDYTNGSARRSERSSRELADIDAGHDALGRLEAPLGVFAVLGNHDWAWSGSETARHLTENGITVLQDDVITLTDPDSGQHLQIIGYEDLTSGRHPNYDRVHAQCNPDLPQISLAHSPDTFPRAKGGPGLMFSGHTHGGQVCLPFLGPLVLPLHNRLYDYGWFVEGTRRLYVTSGMGTSLPPLRFMMPPEVVVLDLMPVENLEMKED